MVAKLSDLGLSRVVKQHSTHRTTNTVGTMSHMPPEVRQPLSQVVVILLEAAASC
jgi:serine/threonine protein kinase